MKALAGAVAIVLVFAAAVAAFAPAAVVDERIASHSNGSLRVADARGTVWRGSGALTPQDGSWRLPIAWQLKPWPLLGQVLDVALVATPDARFLQGRFEAASETLMIRDLQATIPAHVLGARAGGQRLAVGGDIDVRADALKLARTDSTGLVTAVWKGARVAGPALPEVDAGVVMLRLTARGNALVGPVTNQGGQATITGDVVLQADRIGANLRLQPNEGATRELRDALASLGPADANGAVTVRFQHSLR
jgi:hypothetical protein